MLKTTFVLLTTCMLAACAPMVVTDTSPQDAPDTPKTIEIGGTSYDKYTLWACRDYINDDLIALELVRIDKTMNDITDDDLAKSIQENKKIQDKNKALIAIDKIRSLFSKLQIGFILLDNRREYKQTFYTREGINHRWDWDEKYSFILKPDGTGLYYDFTNVKKGGLSKASDVFKCREVYK